MDSPHLPVAAQLMSRRAEIAARVANKHLQNHPEIEDRYGAPGRTRCLEDAAFHLQYLGHALQLSTPSLFVAYTQWTRQVLEKRGIGWRDLQTNFELLRDELVSELDSAGAAVVRDYIDRALETDAPQSESFLSGSPREPLARTYLAALLQANRRKAMEIIQEAVRDGVSIRDLYLHVFQLVQREIGRLWQNNEISVAQEHYCTASTQGTMAQFYPQLLATPRVGRKVVVACVGNELHEIGTRMVADFFEMAGWDGIYLGANTPAAALVDLVCRERPNVVALGVTMTYHLGDAAEMIRRLRSDERCADVIIILGGYVFALHEQLWQTVGADGSAPDAEAAVALANQLVDGS